VDNCARAAKSIIDLPGHEATRGELGCDSGSSSAAELDIETVS
jgi:hypothetical protein